MSAEPSDVATDLNMAIQEVLQRHDVEHTESQLDDAAWAAFRIFHTLTDDPSPEVLVILDDTDEERDEVLVVCPWADCSSTEFYEVDRSVRWNPMEVSDEPQPDRVQKIDRWTGSGYAYVDVGPNPLADLPVLTVSRGSDGDGFETDHHLCQGCHKQVSLPDWLDTEWTC